MYQSEDYFVLQLHRAGDERLLHELELRRVIAERRAETAEAGEGVTDAARPRRGIRALLPRRLRPLAPPRAIPDAGTLPSSA
ncbi:hypothetical protein [Agromyces sp. Soil535]|uniref:hypothetical protein n=1 Tax=Agromyces sp. Soil535 TaxID=1736390 RepID=UPI0006FA4155|nr:hypothetical protein [Agromyces sp. Soil535]KRE28915.1 hypothetical protein ASG80_20820 [Agromyces sp. Soil535]